MSNVPDRVKEIMAAVHNLHVLATVDADGKPQMRWMGALVEHPEQPWTFFLACGKVSRKMAQIAANPHAQLLFSKEDDWQMATLSGTAEAVDCEHCRKLLWDGCPAMHQYYSGVDDPNMGIIMFTTRCMESVSMAEGLQTHCFEL